MKHLLVSSIALSMLLGTMPAAAATDCSTLHTVRRATCIRLQRQSDALKAGALDKSTIDRRVLQKVQQNRRSDTQDRDGLMGQKVQRRTTVSETLKVRRTAAMKERQTRLEQERARRNVFTTTRLNLLRERLSEQVGEPARDNVMTKAILRSTSRSLDDTAQKKRNAVKKAHEACKDVQGGEKLQCLKEARDDILGN